MLNPPPIPTEQDKARLEAFLKQIAEQQEKRNAS